MKTNSPLPKQHAAGVRFRRLLVILVVAGVAVTGAALIYLRSYGLLSTTLIVTVVFGVFVSILLGGGLMATGFYSSESGIDESAARAQIAPVVPIEPAGLDDTTPNYVSNSLKVPDIHAR